MAFLYAVLTAGKWLFGLGALCVLLGIGLICLWFLLRLLVRRLLLGQPAERYPQVRKLFLET
jgi:hypothetical protein